MTMPCTADWVTMHGAAVEQGRDRHRDEDDGGDLPRAAARDVDEHVRGEDPDGHPDGDLEDPPQPLSVGHAEADDGDDRGEEGRRVAERRRSRATTPTPAATAHWTSRKTRERSRSNRVRDAEPAAVPGPVERLDDRGVAPQVVVHGRASRSGPATARAACRRAGRAGSCGLEAQGKDGIEDLAHGRGRDLRARAALPDDDHDGILRPRRRPVAREPRGRLLAEHLAGARLAGDRVAVLREAGLKAVPAEPPGRVTSPRAERTYASTSGRSGTVADPLRRDRRRRAGRRAVRRPPPAAATACRRWRSRRRPGHLQDRHRRVALPDGEVDGVTGAVLVAAQRSSPTASRVR